MPLSWLDVGSWPSFAQTCEKDAAGNALGAARHLLLDTKQTLVASDDPNHTVTAIGCEGLIIIHTKDATLVANAHDEEAIRKVAKMLEERGWKEYL